MALHNTVEQVKENHRQCPQSTAGRWQANTEPAEDTEVERLTVLHRLQMFTQGQI